MSSKDKFYTDIPALELIFLLKNFYKMKKNGFLVFFVICIMAACQSNAANTPPKEETIAPKDSIKRLQLTFVGDIMGHEPMIKAAYNANTKEYEYDEYFKFVKPVLEQADYAVGNLELTLSERPPYTGYPMFRSPDALAPALKGAGFDMLTTCNNHSSDNGAYGITHTLDMLEAQGFEHTGTFRDANEKAANYPFVTEKNGIKMVYLNYTYDTNGMPVVPPTIVNLIDETQMKADIERAKTLQPDMIIVIMHWGIEYQLQPRAEQIQLADKLFLWGADMIIGGHPHVIEPIETRTLPNGKKGYIVYSLGNFISNQKQPNTNGGLMVNIELVKNTNTGKTTIGEHSYIPVYRWIKTSGGRTTYYAVPISAAEQNPAAIGMDATNAAQMKTFAEKMRAHLNKNGMTTEKMLPLSLLPTTNEAVVQLPIATKTATPAVPLGDYKIQWFASTTKQANLKRPANNPYSILKEGKLYKYYLHANSAEEAEVLLKKVRKNGYPKAFIVQ
jgi:poly-gamma-glutamate synthesis protein (capsule biosynthesis protein)